MIVALFITSELEMSELKKIGILWADLLEIKSLGYLIRAKIEQNISIVLSNISSSFMGNRQLANHNTDDIKFNIEKIIGSKFGEADKVSKLIQLRFLNHRQKLNKRLLSNSEDLLSAIENLQSVQKKIMSTNEEIIRFNTSAIELSSNLLSEDHDFGEDERKISVDEELDKLMESCSMSRKKCQILTKKIEDVFEANTKAQLEVQSKREKIMTNRRNISELRKVIDVFI